MEKAYYLTKSGDTTIQFETDSPKLIGKAAMELLAEGAGQVFIHNRKTGKIRTLPKTSGKTNASRLPKVTVDGHNNVVFVWDASNLERNDRAVYEKITDSLKIGGVTVKNHPPLTDLSAFKKFVTGYLVECRDGYNPHAVLDKMKDIDQMAEYINANYKTWKMEVFPYLEKLGWSYRTDNPDIIGRQGDKLLMVSSRGLATILAVNNRMELVEKIQRRIKATGLPMTLIAERSGIPIANLYKILKGTYNPTLDLLDRLVNILGMKLDVIENG